MKAATISRVAVSSLATARLVAFLKHDKLPEKPRKWFEKKINPQGLKITDQEKENGANIGMVA